MRTLAINPLKGSSFKGYTVFVFSVAIILRLLLSLVNYEANDDHISVIRVIAIEGRLPITGELHQSFQPKLYHMTASLIYRLSPIKTRRSMILIGQLLSVAAGIVTLYVALMFLRKMDISEKTRFISFSFMALNPRLIGINCQATNDSFVIAFATLSIYFIVSFLKNEVLLSFFSMMACAVFAGLSKGNGLVIFFGVLTVFIFRIIASRKVRRRFYLKRIFIFFIMYIAIVPVAGQYYYKYKNFGSAFVTNMKREPSPCFFKETPTKAPGVMSVWNAYFTFRLGDMLKRPIVSNVPELYRLNRTSLWSQLFGRTHFLFFDNWPPTWQTNNPIILDIGRVSMIMALLPTAILVFSAVICAFMWLKIFIKKGLTSFIIDTKSWALDIFLFGYLSFILLYSFQFRHYGVMKVIFIFPALLPAIVLFAAAIESFYGWVKRYSKVADLYIFILLSIYVIQPVILLFKLMKLSAGA